MIKLKNAADAWRNFVALRCNLPCPNYWRHLDGSANLTTQREVLLSQLNLIDLTAIVESLKNLMTIAQISIEIENKIDLVAFKNHVSVRFKY